MTPSKQGNAKAKGVPAPTGAATDSAAPRTTRTCLQNQLRKTRFCVYNTKGNCRYGSECAWAHSEEELHHAPDLSKTRICVPFMEEGRCDDPNCNFAHGEEELRSTDMFYRKVLCIWNAKGRCRNGENCRFAHGHKALAQQQPRDQRRAPMRAGPPEPGAAPRGPGEDAVAPPEARGGAAADAGAPPGPGTAEAAERWHARPRQQKEQQRREPGGKRTEAAPPSIVVPRDIGASPAASTAYVSMMSNAGASSPLSYEPMKIYPVTHTGDEHPGSVMGQAAAHGLMPRGDAENLTHQLESLCQQLTALTRRMSSQGAAGLPHASRALGQVASALAPLSVPAGRYGTPGSGTAFS